MASKITLDWPVVVRPEIKNGFLKNLNGRFPVVGKVLSRLPHNVAAAIFDDDYFVTERLVERGFFYMGISGLPVGAKILDVGCRYSSLAFELAALGFLSYGLDLGEYPFKHPNLTSVKGSICERIFEQRFFDAVSAVSTIEHIGTGWYGGSPSESDTAAVAEILRILKPGGRFIFTAPYGRLAATKVFRVYDRDSLSKLTKDFKIIDERYFVAGADGKSWRHSDEKEASSQGINLRGVNTGNVCLALLKQ